MSWDDLEARRRGERHEPAKADPELETLCWLVFGAGKGAELLDKLHARHVDRPVNPLASESALRVFEAERQFVLRLQSLTSRGKTQDAQRAQRDGK